MLKCVPTVMSLPHFLVAQQPWSLPLMVFQRWPSWRNRRKSTWRVSRWKSGRNPFPGRRPNLGEGQDEVVVVVVVVVVTVVVVFVTSHQPRKREVKVVVVKSPNCVPKKLSFWKGKTFRISYIDSFLIYIGCFGLACLLSQVYSHLFSVHTCRQQSNFRSQFSNLLERRWKVASCFQVEEKGERERNQRKDI